MTKKWINSLSVSAVHSDFILVFTSNSIFSHEKNFFGGWASGMRFNGLDVFSVIQPTMSNHWRKIRALTTPELILSSLHWSPFPGYWRKWNHSFYAISPKLIKTCIQHAMLSNKKYKWNNKTTTVMKEIQCSVAATENYTHHWNENKTWYAMLWCKPAIDGNSQWNLTSSVTSDRDSLCIGAVISVRRIILPSLSISCTTKSAYLQTHNDDVDKRTIGHFIFCWDQSPKLDNGKKFM